MTPAEVLLKAAKLIEQVGWTQRRDRDENGCLCVGRAIEDAQPSFHFGLSIQTQSALTAYLGESYVRWNDAEGRTKDEVVAALRACAEQVAA